MDTIIRKYTFMVKWISRVIRFSYKIGNYRKVVLQLSLRYEVRNVISQVGSQYYKIGEYISYIPAHRTELKFGSANRAYIARRCTPEL